MADYLIGWSCRLHSLIYRSNSMVINYSYQFNRDKLQSTKGEVDHFIRDRKGRNTNLTIITGTGRDTRNYPVQQRQEGTLGINQYNRDRKGH